MADGASNDGAICFPDNHFWSYSGETSGTKMHLDIDRQYNISVSGDYVLHAEMRWTVSL